jgi:electron transport complex protein RnfB
MIIDLTEHIDALLPQTQCTRCGYPACKPYAQAIANSEADIDRCPPGGEAGVAALAQLLGRTTKPLNPSYGIEAPPSVALIDEDVCIGCTKCIQACPVDAIVGAAKRMHSIIAAECTGCELCIPPGPVDCISMSITAPEPITRTAVLARATLARERYVSREQRLARDLDIRKIARDQAKIATNAAPPPITRNAVLEAIARGKARRAAGADKSNS